MIEEIKLVLERGLWCKDSHKISGIDTAAQAIAKLVEERPVSKVQAMAALTSVQHFAERDEYDVVGDEVGFNETDGFWCCACNDDDCDHIAAVRLYLAQRERT